MLPAQEVENDAYFNSQTKLTPIYKRKRCKGLGKEAATSNTNFPITSCF